MTISSNKLFQNVVNFSGQQWESINKGLHVSDETQHTAIAT